MCIVTKYKYTINIIVCDPHYNNTQYIYIIIQIRNKFMTNLIYNILYELI
uniref:Uncharacterized protein n=1 Tax=Laurenciella marilzae TaxID=1413812 RepID=A0A1Z1M169_9FLOR|nr:hypothetical protein [Laurenciella marilzae]ARW59827.1 hypothetical protein [Laurenciella marilzae]